MQEKWSYQTQLLFVEEKGSFWRREELRNTKKALKTKTWSDIECKESEEEYTNICLMAHFDSDSKSETNSNLDSNKELEG